MGEITKEDLSPSKVSSQPLSDRVYHYLKEAIIKNDIKPRNIIREKDIAAVFNSSTTPVREAIKRLAAEGFLEVSPYRYAIVSETTYKKYQEICQTLCILDSFICKQAIKELSDLDLQKIKEMTLEMERYCSPDTLEEYLEINTNIHITIWESLKNEFLYSTIRQVYDKLLHGHRHNVYSEWTRHSSHLKKSLRIHKKLTDALIARDTSQINRIVKNHWKT